MSRRTRSSELKASQELLNVGEATAGAAHFSFSKRGVGWKTVCVGWKKAKEAIAGGEDDHRIIRRVSELRDESALRSPVEIGARVLNEVDIRRIVAALGARRYPRRPKTEEPGRFLAWPWSTKSTPPLTTTQAR